LAVVFLGLGSNLGDRRKNIDSALELIDGTFRTSVKKVSSLYETEPVGYTDQPDFLNAVALVETERKPEEFMSDLLEVEHEMGRIRNVRWGPRVIDIDILMFDDLEMDTPGLTLPHPRMAERAFVLAPLAEIAPKLLLPDGRTPGEALVDLTNQRVRRVAEK